MCGGLSVSATGSNPSQQIAYHGLRLIGYLSLGALAGWIGEDFFYLGPLKILSRFMGWVFALVLIYSGVRLLRGKKLRYSSQWLSHLAEGLMKKGFQLSPLSRSAVVGFASVFLPCGWLYSFVLLSLATHSAVGGLLTLFVFWLGTLPALMGGQIVLQNLLRKLEVSGQKLTGALMILAAIASLQLHFHAPSASSQSESPAPQTLICH